MHENSEVVSEPLPCAEGEGANGGAEEASPSTDHQVNYHIFHKKRIYLNSNFPSLSRRLWPLSRRPS